MAKSKPLKFEQAVEKIEQIIERIESGEVDLGQCLEQYESGVKLVKHCNQILQHVEKKVAQLSVDADGQLQVKG